MKIGLLSLGFVFIFNWAFAQNFSFNDDQIKSRLYKDVSVLAHDSLLGRESGTLGEKKAVEYISDQFEKAGLEFHPDLNSFVQEFSFIPNKHADTAWIKTATDTLLQKRDFFITHYSSTDTISGVVNYLDNITLLNLIKENNTSQFKNQVLLIDAIDNDSLTKIYPDTICSITSRIEYIINLGAKAIILRGDIKNYFALRNPTSLIKPRIPVVYIITEYSEKDIVNQHIELAVVRPEPINAKNVIGCIHNNAEHTIVIGAHFDHLGNGHFGSHTDSDTSIHNGADDNASGTAVILELARQIKHNNLKNYNYVFVAFGAEERGKIGSEFFVNSNLISLEDMNYFVNYDMVGRMRKLRNKLFIVGLGSSPELYKTVKDTPYKRGRLKVYKGTHGGSDHYYFDKNAIPYLSFTTGLHFDYHKPQDDTNTLNYKGMTKTAKYSYKLIEKLDREQKVSYSVHEQMKLVNWIWTYLP